jgi:uncharacterized membrane protein YbhN (UPF0104 family)
MKHWLRRGLTAAGIALSVLAIAALGRTLADTVTREGISEVLHSGKLNLLLAFALYLLSFIWMSGSWVFIARAARIEAPARVLVRIFLVSQVAKYLPGNIGHLLGRVLLGAQAGLQTARLSFAVGLELAATFAACSVLVACALGLALVLGILPEFDVGTAGTINRTLSLTAAAILVSIAVLLVASRVKHISGWLEPMLASFGLLILTLVFSALVALLCFQAVAGIQAAGSAFLIAAAFVISWLAGFITPGSPAGIGIREYVFVTLLSSTHPVELLTLAVVVTRFVTLSGDFIAFLIGLTIRPPFAEHGLPSGRDQ